MTSGGGMFSPEEIRYLKSLPAVAEVTAKRITYTDEFKRYCIRRYNEGASPVRLFRDAGLDPALIGYKRIERCIARWRAVQSRNMHAALAVLAKTPAGGGIESYIPARNTGVCGAARIAVAGRRSGRIRLPYRPRTARHRRAIVRAGGARYRLARPAHRAAGASRR